MKTIKFLSILTVCLFACGEDDDNNIQPDNSNIIEFQGQMLSLPNSTVIYTGDENSNDNTFKRLTLALHTEGIFYDSESGNFTGKGSIFYTNFSSPDTFLVTGTYNYDAGVDSSFQFRGGILAYNIDYSSSTDFIDENIAVVLGGSAEIINNGEDYVINSAIELEPFIDIINNITDESKRFTVSSEWNINEPASFKDFTNTF